MRYQRHLVLGVIGVLTALLVTSLAYSGTPTPVTTQSKAQSQAFTSTGLVATTSSTDFEEIPAFALELCRPQSGISLDLSMELSGAPVDVRVRARRKVLRPSQVAFDPGASSRQGFSYTFVRDIRRLNGPVAVEWRSTTGAEATMHSGTLRALFQARRGSNSACL